MVQFYPWFKFSFLLFQTHYHIIIIHYHTQKQKKRKFEPRIKLNHDMFTKKKHPLTEHETVKEQTYVLKMGTLHTKQSWGQLLNDMRNYADLTG